MKFELFRALYSEALEYEDFDMYVAERGYQDWMDSYENIADVLKTIYDLAHSTIKQTREGRDIPQAAFGRIFAIPVRSLQNWDAGVRTPPAYIKMLLDYAVFNYK